MGPGPSAWMSELGKISHNLKNKEAVLRTAGSHRMGSIPIPCISSYECVRHLGMRNTTGLKIFSYSYVGPKDLRNRFSLEVEHEAFNLRVVGSIPTIGSCLIKAKHKPL